MRELIFSVLSLFLLAIPSCGDDGGGGGKDETDVTQTTVAERNMIRAMAIMDAAVPAYFQGSGMLLSEYYNPYTGAVSGTGGSDASCWKYTAAIEAVNQILLGLKAHKAGGNAKLYDSNYQRYVDLLDNLFEGGKYYKGTYQLVSYTQTRSWTVYAVPRGNAPGGADPGGDSNRYNVYDDQMWIIREMLESYKATGDRKFLEEAEYLTEYVLDGWDCTLDADGNENGGIPWGPGYVTKHSCSNGPMISPLVWLHELYKDTTDEVTYGYIGAEKARLTRTVKKADYYLDFAERIYAWQKKWLLRGDGVYHDMRGGCNPCNPLYETVGGVTYRRNSPLSDVGGTAHTYNAGSMLSGAADLYRVTGKAAYKSDAEALSVASFTTFAKASSSLSGYYNWPLDGYAVWFNGVLFRAFIDAKNISVSSAQRGIDSFQANLDHAYGAYNHKGFLPTNLLGGWSSTDANNKVNVMFTSVYAAEFARLARQELETK